MARVDIWTDGGCEPNPGVGGWGALLICGEHQKELYGSEPESTNQRMEIRAAVSALAALKTPCEARVYSDSQYLIYSMTGRYRRGANTDLWHELDTAAEAHTVEWIKVEAHKRRNRAAHDLARKGIKEAEKGVITVTVPSGDDSDDTFSGASHEV